MPRFPITFNLFFIAAALVWRRLLWRTTVVAITGSYGKTTTKDCLRRILAAKEPTESTAKSISARSGLPRTILRTRHWHRFLVMEIGIDSPGYMWRSRLLVKPDIAVILGIGPAHSMNFGDMETTAKEKAQLLRGVRGAAVLNRDDPRVRAMASRVQAPIVWFGWDRQSDVRIESADWSWDQGLQVRLRAGDESAEIHTELLGTHWAMSIAAAVAAAQACGVPLQEAARAVQGGQAFTARMQRVQLANGATLIRDECNGSIATLDHALTVLRESGAKRRIAILTDFYDGPADETTRLRLIACKAIESADLYFFVGEKAHPLAEQALVMGAPAEQVQAFSDLKEAAETLRATWKPGDVALLKGLSLEHLPRIAYSQTGTVDCWRQPCGKRLECDDCSLLGYRPAPDSSPKADF